jgi:hypothetical protein
MTGCGKCHACRTTLRSVLDGEEWCPKCHRYRRYRSHGWSSAVANAEGDAKCPTLAQCPTCHGSSLIRLVPPPAEGGWPVGAPGVCSDAFHGRGLFYAGTKPLATARGA